VARLFESTPKERSGTLPCDEEGCKLTRIAIKNLDGVVGYAQAGDCILQLRLRAGLTKDIDFTRNDVERIFGNLTDWQWEVFKGFFICLRSGGVERPQA